MNTFGHLFRITTWGESHGGAVGVVVDGCPPQLALDIPAIQFELNRRKPGQSHLTTPRQEGDVVEVLSGVFEGKTLGTPISMLVWNKKRTPLRIQTFERLVSPVTRRFHLPTEIRHPELARRWKSKCTRDYRARRRRRNCKTDFKRKVWYRDSRLC